MLLWSSELSVEFKEGFRVVALMLWSSDLSVEFIERVRVVVSLLRSSKISVEFIRVADVAVVVAGVVNGVSTPGHQCGRSSFAEPQTVSTIHP